jgi:hypothetical protein
MILCVNVSALKRWGSIVSVLDINTKRNFDFSFLFECLYEIQHKYDIMKLIFKTRLFV